MHARLLFGAPTLCDVKMPHLFSKALDMQSQQLLIVLANSISIMTALHIGMYLRKYCRHMYDAFVPIIESIPTQLPTQNQDYNTESRSGNRTPRCYYIA